MSKRVSFTYLNPADLDQLRGDDYAAIIRAYVDNLALLDDGLVWLEHRARTQYNPEGPEVDVLETYFARLAQAPQSILFNIGVNLEAVSRLRRRYHGIVESPPTDETWEKMAEVKTEIHQFRNEILNQYLYVRVWRRGFRKEKFGEQ